MFKDFKHIHFIGIGGSGISSLAHLALARNRVVTGSDAAESTFVRNLKAVGVKITIGHHRDNLPKMVNLIIYSEAIDKNKNPEYLLAKEWGIPTLSYFEALGELSKIKKTIVVTGSHGKTTTTAMLGCALKRAGFSPTVIMGSQVAEFEGLNIYIGKGDFLVLEGCEYRRSFLHLQPYGVIILNCEPDHLDYYKDEADYREAYRELVSKIPEGGFLVANAEDGNARIIAGGFSGKKILIQAEDVERLNFKLQLIGDFNQWNAVHAYKAAKLIGADTAIVRKALTEFKGARRRTEIKGQMRGAIIVDDYGHHPTEIKVTLRAIKQKFPGQKVICVFEPHQYNRTKQFLNEFSQSFDDADMVIIPGIYAARDSEEDKKSVNAKILVEKIAKKHPHVIYGENFRKTEDIVRRTAKSGDVILVMGAGEIGEVANRLLET